MSRIDRLPPSGPPAPDPTPGRREGPAPLSPTSGFDARALQGAGAVIARLMRELFGGALQETEGLLTSPPLPRSMSARPDGKELQRILRRVAERPAAGRGPAEERLAAVLRDLIAAQDRVLHVLARQTKA